MLIYLLDMGNVMKIKLPQKNSDVFYKKKWFIILAILVVIVLGAATAAIIIYRQKSMLQTSNTNTAKTVQARAESINGTIADAQQASRTGDAASANEVYDKAVTASSDDYQKSVLLIGKATLYFNSADYKNALEYAQQAEAYDKNVAVYDFIAQIYEKLGNKASAAEYYKKTISVLDSSSPLYSQDLKYYQDNVKRLSAI